MGSLPKINVTKSGKRYFKVNGRKIYIQAGVTRKQILSIYKALQKTIKTKTVNTNKASAVVNINNGPSRRSNRRRRYVKFNSTINPLNRVSVSGSDHHPKDSGDKDLINKLINEKQKDNQMTLTGPQNPQNLLIDYTDLGRISKMKQDPDFLNPNIPRKYLAYKFGLMHYYQDPNEPQIDEPEEQSNVIEPDVKKEPGLEGEYNPDILDEHIVISPQKKKTHSEIQADEDIANALRAYEDNQMNEEYDPYDSSGVFSSKPPEEKNREVLPELIQSFDSFDPNATDHINISILRRMVNVLKDRDVQISSIPTRIGEETQYRTKFKNEIHGISDDLLDDAYQQAKQRFGNAEKKISEVEQHKKERKAISDAKPKKDKKTKEQEFEQRINRVQSAGMANGGLYNDQINQIMSKFQDFKGTIMKDEIKKLLPNIQPQSRLAFIINTDTSDKPGSHWQAIYIDGRSGPESSNSLEFYDSFGRSIPSDVLEDCKLILKILKPETILKVKENRVIMQSDDTSNCGWFCCRFLIDRFRGQSFSSATGFDEKQKINHIRKDEAEIERMKKEPPFNYISV